MTLRIFVLLLLWPVGVFAQDLVTPSDRVTTHVNIRAAAEDGAAQIGQLDIGKGLPLVRSVPRWYEVQLPNGQTGFVSKAFTTVSRARWCHASWMNYVSTSLTLAPGAARSSNALEPMRHR